MPDKKKKTKKPIKAKDIKPKKDAKLGVFRHRVGNITIPK